LIEIINNFIKLRFLHGFLSLGYGINTILFLNNDQIKRELADLNVKIDI